MSEPVRSWVGGVAIVAAALLAAPAALAAGSRQTASVTFTTTRPGAPTGSRFDFAFRNPEHPDEKPYAVARFVVHYPRGLTIDTTVPPQCHASDAQLYAQGASACPADTKIGSGVAVSDTGGGGPLPRYTRTDISQFNNRDEVVGVGQNEDIPAIRTVTRTELRGSTASTNFPPFPGLPPPEPYTPLKTLTVDFPPYVRDGRTYARTPRRCPRARHWTIRIDFTYRDGVTQTVASRSPCTARHRRAHRRRAHHRRHHPRFTG